mmetsp:Transcript_91821/g.259967  ORF Transcript_91821/g.259967 Transcript_91821/m.259967 type:complete len:251 (-) Transcript_91821:581-1333(-)
MGAFPITHLNEDRHVLVHNGMVAAALTSVVASGGKLAGDGLVHKHPSDGVVALADGVSRVGLVVNLEVGRHGHRKLQPRKVDEDALVAVGRPEVPVGPAKLARLAGVCREVEGRQAVEGPCGDHEVHKTLRCDRMGRAVDLPAQRRNVGGRAHEVAGRPAAEGACNLPVVMVVLLAGRHVVACPVIAMNRRVVLRGAFQRKAHAALEALGQQWRLVEGLPRGCVGVSGQHQTEQHEVGAAVADGRKPRHH